MLPHLFAFIPGGMPTVTLTDVAALRLQTISFFLVVFLLLFSAGLSGTAIAHQFVWLATSPEPLLDRSGIYWSESRNQLKQIGLALHNYHDTHSTFPPGGTFDETGRGRHSFLTLLLPYLEQKPLFDRIDLARPWNHPANAEAMATRVRAFENPAVYEPHSNSQPLAPATANYAANAYLLGANRGLRFSDITDGPSSTLLAGEAAGNFQPWGAPTNLRDPTLGINATPDGFGGPQKGGAQFLLTDGDVRFINEQIDPATLKAIATPAGGESAADF